MSTITQNLKNCKVCQRTKPLSEFKVSWFGHEHKCIECRKPNRQGLARRRNNSGVKERKCSVCETWKPQDVFEANRDNPEGIGYRCRDCTAKRAYVRYLADPKASNEANKADYYRHREDRLQQVRRYREDNIEAIRAYDRGRAADRYRENPEKRAEYAHARRAREINAPGSFTAREFRQLCEKYDNRCLCCGGKPDKLTLDHVIPLSRGGSNSIDNIQPLCMSCNLQKSTKTVDYRPGDI